MTTHLQKTYLVAFSLLFLLGITSVQNEAAAQLAVGGGLAFGTDIEAAGIQAGGTYFLLEEQGIRLALDLIFFFPGEDAVGFDINVFEINANGHYIFNEGDAFIAYALAGLSLATVSVDVDLGPFGGTQSASDSELGLNAGAGIEYSIGGVKLYGEGKLVLGGFDQFVLSGGVRVPLGGN
ncbi:MAG: outer membrane beta-barrel protein [Rhodothermaceae bacterium]|nr:outer membrane beta-barrel protein [Rhodothermaceae bacterium]